MNLKYIFIALVIGVLLCGVIGYALHLSFPGGATTTNYQSALSQVALYNWQSDVVTSLSAVRAPLAGVGVTTTASIDFPSVSSTTPSGTTTAPGLAAVAGDIILISPATSTAGVGYSISLATPSATSATFEIDARVASGSTAIDPTATTFQITVLPTASFKAPAALSVSTTSTP